MDEQTEEIIRRLESWSQAYPTSMFSPMRGDPIKKTEDYDTAEKRNLITRASAAMGRHMIEVGFADALTEIKRLAARIEELEAQ